MFLDISFELFLHHISRNVLDSISCVLQELFSFQHRRPSHPLSFMKKGNGFAFQRSHVTIEQLKKTPGCLGYVGDYTTQLCGDF